METKQLTTFITVFLLQQSTQMHQKGDDLLATQDYRSEKPWNQAQLLVNDHNERNPKLNRPQVARKSTKRLQGKE